ncbi:glutamate receptor ionotropic, delta-1-like [Centruroides vittatus]|uniref:glutamate receptor ionotropic, delta-1-like n=1 Tax=Centruroides vittatus TaxID=120091 RepID=UPI00350FFA98
MDHAPAYIVISIVKNGGAVSEVVSNYSEEMESNYVWKIAGIDEPAWINVNQSNNQIIRALQFYIFKTLQEKLEFRYEVVQPMPKTVIQQHPNGSYYGMIGQIINKEADMSAFPMYMSKNVFDLADFSSITHMIPVNFIIKEQKLKPNWKTIFRPFTFEVNDNTIL